MCCRGAATMSTSTFTLAHLNALAVPHFDIGVLRPDDVMIRRLGWTPAQVERALAWMRLQNLEGAQIFVRPSLTHIATVLVDDIPTHQVRNLDLNPAAVVETSPGNSQCWIRLNRSVPVGHARAIARALQDRWNADPGSADGQHFGRLAGFTNRWPKHRRPDGTFPLVRLLGTSHAVYNPDSIALWEPPVPANPYPRSGARSEATRPVRPIEEFWYDPQYGGDLHRADLAWAIAALRAGEAFDEVAHRLASSRDLSKKGSARRQTAYVQRTVAKAQELLLGA